MAAQSASQDLLGKQVTGRKKTWNITKEISVSPGDTPGNFSYAYEVESEDGERAFLKASDLGMASLKGIDFLDRLVIVGHGHQFERQVLDLCRGHNMDRVVVAVDYGDMEVVFAGIRDRVFFIIFELAKSDLRYILRKNETQTLLWTLIALQNLFIGIRQLHAGGVCHNDFKPANCLLFDERLQKVADLGRATSNTIRAPHDGLCLGDVRFAAPEQLYAVDRVTDAMLPFDRGRAGDLYSLGSVVHYMMAHRMVTPEIVQTLDDQFRPQPFYGGWQDSYAAVLPHWRLQFDALMEQLRLEQLQQMKDGAAIRSELLRMVGELCEPDPRLRGHPRNQMGAQDGLSLSRYITELDFLAQKARLLKV